jgi:Putative DNA-binding domain
MIPVTQASQFFDALPAEPKEAFAKLSSLILESSPEREAEWLDYKNGKNIPLDTTDGKKKIRELWSKSLSGFANSGGGLVIWGIDTKPVDKHDVPTYLALVPNPNQLEGLLKNYLATEVEPPVLNVRLRSIADENGEGFVVADIPPSELKPHEAKFQGCYYIRASHQHVVAGPSLLRILFYPNSSPVLELACDSDTYSGSPAHGYTVKFQLHNKGYATATDLLIEVKTSKGDLKFHPDRTNFYFDELGPVIFPLRGKHDLHPSRTVYLGECKMFAASSFFTVLAFGKDFQPCQWSVELTVEGRAKVEGPFDIRAGLTPEG